MAQWSHHRGWRDAQATTEHIKFQVAQWCNHCGWWDSMQRRGRGSIPCCSNGGMFLSRCIFVAVKDHAGSFQNTSHDLRRVSHFSTVFATLQMEEPALVDFIFLFWPRANYSCCLLSFIMFVYFEVITERKKNFWIVQRSHLCGRRDHVQSNTTLTDESVCFAPFTNRIQISWAQFTLNLVQVIAHIKIKMWHRWKYIIWTGVGRSNQQEQSSV